MRGRGGGREGRVGGGGGMSSGKGKEKEMHEQTNSGVAINGCPVFDHEQ